MPTRQRRRRVVEDSSEDELSHDTPLLSSEVKQEQIRALTEPPPSSQLLRRRRLSKTPKSTATYVAQNLGDASLNNIPPPHIESLNSIGEVNLVPGLHIPVEPSLPVSPLSTPPSSPTLDVPTALLTSVRKAAQSSPNSMDKSTAGRGMESPARLEDTLEREPPSKVSKSCAQRTADIDDRRTRFEDVTAENRAKSRKIEQVHNEPAAEDMVHKSRSEHSGSSGTIARSMTQLSDDGRIVKDEKGNAMTASVLDQANSISQDVSPAVTANENMNGVTTGDADAGVETSTSKTGQAATNGAARAEHIAEHPPKVQTLADVILRHIKESRRKIFVRGDVAMIIDEADLSKTWLLPSHKIISATPTLLQPGVAGQTAAAIQRIFTLRDSRDVDGSQMPLFYSVDPTQTLVEFQSRHHKPNTRTRAATEKAGVKDEGAQVDRNVELETIIKMDWLKAYRTAFAIITGLPRLHIFKQLSLDNAPLLQQVQGVITIANHYGALRTVRPSLEILLKDFMERKTLWKAVAGDPAAWLMIGRAVEDAMVYEEAMIHLVGLYPASLDRMVAADVPEDVQKLVGDKSRHLMNWRTAIHQELLTLRVEIKYDPETKGRRKKPLRELVGVQPSSPGSQAYFVWLAHIADQIRQLKNTNLGMMGFYRAIRKGGDSYLPPDKIVAEWCDDDLPYDDDQIRDTLRSLKQEAGMIATPLTRSTLRFEDKETLDYLTCVKIEPSDIPFMDKDDADLMDEDDAME